MNTPINFDEIQISESIKLYGINIEKLDNDFKKLIDDNLIEICKGKREIKLSTVKKEFLKYLNSKNESNLLTGSVAEFFIHLFLKTQKFKQEFLYFNLEENSIKKGFDGYYTKSNIQWMLESKSTRINNDEHKNHIAKAYNGIKNKIEGIDSQNNPWENAYNHAVLANSHEKIKDKLSALSELYIEEKYKKIDDFNIICASTIYLEGNWHEINMKDLKTEIEKYFKGKKFNSVIAVCVNKKTLKEIINYLKTSNA